MTGGKNQLEGTGKMPDHIGEFFETGARLSNPGTPDADLPALVERTPHGNASR